MSDELEPVLGKEYTNAANPVRSKFEANEDIEDEEDDEPEVGDQ